MSNKSILSMNCIWLDDRSTGLKPPAVLIKDQTTLYNEYKTKISKIDGSIERLKKKTNPNHRKLLEIIIDKIHELNGTINLKENKGSAVSIICSFPVKDKFAPIIQTGLSDSNAPEGIKLDLNFYRFNKYIELSKDIIEPWCKKFYTIGWRGKGAGKDAGKRPLSDEEIKKWIGFTMKYEPDKVTKCFTNKNGEMEIISFFFEIFKDLLQDLNFKLNH